MKTFSTLWGRALVCLMAGSLSVFVVSTSVLAQTIIVSQLNDLDFGTIAAGSSSLVNPGDPTAALFEISISEQDDSNSNHTDNGKNKDNGKGPSKYTVEVAFSLPGSLLQSGSVIPVSFPSESALWNDKNTTHGAKSFDPNQQKSLEIKKNKDLYIYLGGDIQTSRSQRPGGYSAVVSLTVTEMDN